MRFGFITNIPNPYNESLFAALRELGHDVRVLYARSPSAEGREWQVAEHGAEKVATGVRAGHTEVRSLFRSVDVVIVSGSYLDPMAMEALTVVPRRGVPVFFWGERMRGAGYRHPLRRALLARVDGIMTVGRWAEWSYRKVIRQDCRVWNFPYVCDADTAASPSDVDPVVGFVGSLIHRKGLDIVIRALGEMVPSERPVLEVAGDGPEREFLSTLATEAGVHVRWLGFVQKQELRERRSAWTLQVVPSRYDGWGVVVNEALAAGVPALVSSTTGAGVDLIRHGLTGQVVFADSHWAGLIRDSIRDRPRTSVTAHLLGDAVSSDRASVWLATTTQAIPPSADFVRDAFVSVGQFESWNRILASSGRGEQRPDPDWRVMNVGEPRMDYREDAVTACLDPSVAAAVATEGYSRRKLIAISRGGVVGSGSDVAAVIEAIRSESRRRSNGRVVVEVPGRLSRVRP